MAKKSNDLQYKRTHQRWAEFRFSVIGELYADPPGKGELKCRIKKLAAKTWRDPVTGTPRSFSFSTIERWYYQARNCGNTQGPIDTLQRKVRTDHGRHTAVNSNLASLIENQYLQHPDWSYQLHYDNLVVHVEMDEGFSSYKMPSYSTVLRYMKSHGYIRRPRRGPRYSPGAQAAEERYESRQVRSYESEYVNALWHLDFHHGSMRVLCNDGTWSYPVLLAILDDRSRLCCHLQWYFHEGARELCHGLEQAFLKRGLPRAILSDNGSAMIAKETEQGLKRLSILSEHTLPYSPYQNGKQESWWNQIEGRLLPLLDGECETLTLKRLNDVSQAWSEIEYNRKIHRETRRTPLDRFLEEKDVGRPAPAIEELVQAFTNEVTRTQRRSDGTISLNGVRFEIPSRYSHMEKIAIRNATWNPSQAWLCDPKSGAILCRILPQDKQKNAEAKRAPRALRSDQTRQIQVGDQPDQPPALLTKILQQYAATGLPPAYLPTPEDEDTDV